MLEGVQSWFRGKARASESPTAACGKDFPQLWTTFVDAFTDSIHARGPAAPPPGPQVEETPTVLPAAERLVAIGDLHGDIGKTRRAFRIGQLTDENDRWIGGSTVAVQVGDQLDRGDSEVEILYFLERLQREAAAAGGALHILNGNHETMNVEGRFRYATSAGVADFLRWHIVQSIGAGMKRKCGCEPQRYAVPPELAAGRGGSMPSQVDHAVAARWAALAPGGPITQRFLARHPIVLQVGSTVFVHGGILPDHARYGLDRINRETREWMMGEGGGRMPRFLAGRQAVVWAREYSAEERERCDCDTLRKALSMIPGAKRMVVGHTIQVRGINSACEEQVYRIDVGMSQGCGNMPPQVLEITQDSQVRRLSEDRRSQAQHSQQEKHTQTEDPSALERLLAAGGSGIV